MRLMRKEQMFRGGLSVYLRKGKAKGRRGARRYALKLRGECGSYEKAYVMMVPPKPTPPA